VTRIAWLLLACAFTAHSEDLWLRGGRIWTGDTARPWAQSLLVRKVKIAAVGTDAAVGKQAAGARRIELRGRFAMPGCNDSHIHMLGGSLRLAEVDLTGICTLETIQAAIAAYAAKHPEKSWITGGGWEYLCFPGGKLPTSQQLDAVVKDRPVFLSAYDGHSAWANTKALELAGITRETKFEGFGEVVKDAAGEPTGALKEGAQSLVRRLLATPTRERKLAALRDGMRLAASLGITSIQNASGGEDEFSLYEELAAQGELTLRVSMALSTGPGMSEEKLRSWAARTATPMLRTGAIKIMLDGVIESHTAAMLAPYANKPETKGAPAWEKAELDRVVRLADRLGLQILIHAIGDGAVRMALDAYEGAAKANGPRDRRHRIEHIETLQAADMPRFAQLGVIASMQPIHADPGTIEVWSATIGAERTKRGFAWGSLERAGARLVFASDWPASISLDPIRGLHNAVNRKTVTGLPPGGWIPEQRVSLGTALQAYTTHAAHAEFRDKEKGVLRPGALADIVVLTQDPFRIQPERIHQTKAALTIAAGRVVFTGP
jgi:predicted amidohydrolase YtcJ